MELEGGRRSFHQSDSEVGPREEDLYTVKELSNFLRVTKNKKNVSLDDFFPDAEKFLRSVSRAVKH